MTVVPHDLTLAHQLDDALWELPRSRPACDLFQERRMALARAVDAGVGIDEAAAALGLLPADVLEILHP